MYVDIELLHRLEKAWLETSRAIKTVPREGIADLEAELPESLAEKAVTDMGTDVYEAYLELAYHFDDLAKLTRGANDTYQVTDQFWAEQLAKMGRR
ncbi:hypothetical protein [Nocardia otitidiscaviarum]|uniref:hypothetical protein n=1 Tax=Nocardia otitidiscaviarum TaxID=1823 RepID=UPI0018930695|nr:hypothetical protein [Nocardia otitidiscaviarum]MBF6177276.1 hypothetical protein [Nocardia otitidiscaviarum]